MKIILSRKGFDSKYGGMPSPILPDGTLLSLPIPTGNSGVKFSDLKSGYRNKSYFDIINELKPKFDFKRRGICHLDPDVKREVRKREKGWEPAFGQTGGAQTHLIKTGEVKENDLFLFFGWFKQTEYDKKGKLQFIKGKYQDKHIIFGYLQIGKIYNGNVEIQKTLPTYLRSHPHYLNMKSPDYKINCIYEARKELNANFHPKLDGAGCFKYDKRLVLTKDGDYTRTQWDLPSFFKNVKISHHSPDSFKKDHFKSVDIGQEFVIDANRKVIDWANKNIIIGTKTLK